MSDKDIEVWRIGRIRCLWGKCGHNSCHCLWIDVVSRCGRLYWFMTISQLTTASFHNRRLPWNFSHPCVCIRIEFDKSIYISQVPSRSQQGTMQIFSPLWYCSTNLRRLFLHLFLFIFYYAIFFIILLIYLL